MEYELLDISTGIKLNHLEINDAFIHLVDRENWRTLPQHLGLKSLGENGAWFTTTDQGTDKCLLTVIDRKKWVFYKLKYEL